MLNIIIFGAPGSGKGTQSQRLIDKYHLKHISTGDILRNERENSTPLGALTNEFMEKGHLVPDEIMIKLLDEQFLNNTGSVGCIFDGFPRTLPQGKALDEMLDRDNSEISIVLSLEVEDDELVERLLKRGEVSGRNDDNEETIKSRLNVYYNQTAPLKDYYEEQNKLVKVDGSGTIDEIFARIEKTIDKLDY